MKPVKFKPLSTERLSLKPHKPSFALAQRMYHLISANREHFKYLPLVNIQRAEEEFAFLQTAEKNWKEKINPIYGIYLKGTQKLIGSCSLNKISWKAETAEIGYWLGAEYCGHGYMTEALQALEAWSFEAGLNKLLIRANIKNRSSCAIAERLHYQKEGVIRQELFNSFTNEFEDIAYYGKLKSEWKK